MTTESEPTGAEVPVPEGGAASGPVDLLGEPGEKPSYEQARDELDDIVNRLESGGENLATAMTLFKRGEYLAALCTAYLEQARATIEAGKPE